MNLCDWCKNPLPPGTILINGRGFCSPRCESEYERARRDGTLPNEGCFITTAVCKTLKKTDNCQELTTFRYFRDSYMMKTAEMQEEIKEYYEIAPRICFAIESLGEEFSLKKYTTIWETCLKLAIEALDIGDKKKAYEIYRKMVVDLKKEFLSTQKCLVR
jgi:hypothetical protein